MKNNNLKLVKFIGCCKRVTCFNGRCKTIFAFSIISVILLSVDFFFSLSRCLMVCSFVNFCLWHLTNVRMSKAAPVNFRRCANWKTKKKNELPHCDKSNEIFSLKFCHFQWKKSFRSVSHVFVFCYFSVTV